MNKELERKFMEAQRGKAIQDWLGNQPAVSWIDKKGYSHQEPMTYVTLAREIGVFPITVWRWKTTGKVSPVYRKMLVEKGVLSEELL